MIKGMKACLQHLDNARIALDSENPSSKISRVIQIMGNLAYDEVSTGYGGQTGVITEYTLRKNEAKITAKGNQILFLEYGTGVIFPSTNPNASKYGFGPATWTVTHKQWLVGAKRAKFGGKWPVQRGGKWTWTRGTPSLNVMYNAGQKVKSAAKSMKVKVFE